MKTKRKKLAGKKERERTGKTVNSIKRQNRIVSDIRKNKGSQDN
jgi:hypothetical protein